MRRAVVLLGVVLALAVGGPVIGQSEVPAAEPRVIDLEMAGVGRFLRDGAEAPDLSVVPGETVVFRVDNTAGQELGFSVGNQARICDPSRTSRWTIPAWAEGVRELTWSVPAGAANRRWGHKGRYCSLGTFSVPNDSPDDRAPPAPKSTGRLSVSLAHSKHGIRFDADFDGSTTAVVWRYFGDGPREALYLSRSDDARLRDFTTRDVANDVRDQSVAICGPDVIASYIQRAPDDDQRLQLARLPADGGAGSSVEVRAPIERRGTIDVACTADRAYVAWTEQVDGDWRAFVRSVSLPALAPSQIHDAGPAKRYRIAVAATGDHALLAWQDGARIKLGRFEVDANGEQLVPRVTRTIAKRGRDPILDADGARVAVGYDRGNRSFILMSRDGGKSFDRRARFGRPATGGPGGIDSLAVQGRNVVATMVVYYGGDSWDRHRLRSRDWGKTWTRSPIGDPVAAIPIDGFLTTHGGVKVTEAYTDGVYADKYDLRVRRAGLRSRPR